MTAGPRPRPGASSAVPASTPGSPPASGTRSTAASPASGTCASSGPASRPAGSPASRPSLLDDDVVFITPDEVDELSTFGCQIADQVVLTREPKFVGDADRRRGRRHTAGDARVGGLPGRGQLRRARPPCSTRWQAIGADGPLVHAPTTPPIATRPTSTCGRRTAPTSATGSGSAHPACRAATSPAVVTDLDDQDDALADAFADADVIVDEVFHTPAAAHVPMEPHATNAQWVGGRLEVVTGTQTPFNMRQDLAVHLRAGRRGRPGRRPADGRRVRGEDVHPHRGDHGVGRHARRPAGSLRAGPRRGLQRGHPSPRHRAGEARREE